MYIHNRNRSSNHSTLIGVLIVIFGILLGIWLGVWVCFIGGIVQVVDGCKATPTDAMDIAIGLARFCASGLVGWGTALLCFTVGGAFISNGR